MPYKDPNSPAAIESRRRAMRKYEESHREERRQQKREHYWDNPESERQRNKRFKNLLDKEQRCVNCGKERDRGNKTMCSVCAPIHGERTKEQQRRTRALVFEAYGGPKCSCCGETIDVFLTLDHIEKDGAKFRKTLRNGKEGSGGGGTRTYYWLKKNNFPPGYRVLCWNCNSAFEILGYCPHKPPK